MKVAAAVDKASLAKTRSQIEATAQDAAHIKVGDRIMACSVPGLPWCVPWRASKIKPHVDYKPLKAGPHVCQVYWRSVAGWFAGPVEGTFYSKFPALRPWIWPEVDFAYIKTAAKEYFDGVP